MTALKRTKSGPFTIEDAISIDDLDYKTIEKNLVSIKDVLCDLKKIVVDDKILKNLLDGKKVRLDSILGEKTFNREHNNDVIVLIKDEKAVAVANIIDNFVKVKSYF